MMQTSLIIILYLLGSKYLKPDVEVPPPKTSIISRRKELSNTEPLFWRRRLGLRADRRSTFRIQNYWELRELRGGESAERGESKISNQIWRCCYDKLVCTLLNAHCRVEFMCADLRFGFLLTDLNWVLVRVNIKLVSDATPENNIIFNFQFPIWCLTFGQFPVKLTDVQLSQTDSIIHWKIHFSFRRNYYCLGWKWSWCWKWSLALASS